MKPGAYLARAFLWSLAAYALWELAQPISTSIVEQLTLGMLRVSGQPLEVNVQRANRGAVLFLSLYLAHRPAWMDAVRGVAVGIAACLLSQALAIAVLAAVPAHEGLGQRLLRSLAVGIDKAAPLVAWLYLARGKIFPRSVARSLAGAGSQSGASRRR